jgi:hypothetical protein
LASDRPDGSYNPIPQSPRPFINNAEDSIRVDFVAKILPEKIKWLEEAENLKQFIDDTEETRNNVSNEISRLRTDSKLNERIYQDFGELKEFVSRNKVTEALRRYRAGEEFERVLVSGPSAERRVYLSARNLEGYLG